MSTAIKRLGELRVHDYVEGNINNWLVFKPLPNSKMHSSAIDGDVVISATPSVEIVDADLDVAIPAGNLFAYSVATDNRIKIAFSKGVYPDKASAIDALKCVSVTYDIGNLIPNANLYILTVKNSMGEEIHRTTPFTLDKIQTVISTFNDTRATDYDGFLEYVIFPDYIVN
ncbi:hypothetical protein BSK59_12980 [Paenibacillus odorifer]|uniref:hypothetical protein n=1 Tax=Paenibacillus odorifer TaxID=189426 RepID=UPI00096DBF8A|nr:hypothetical protein [Paenibacillus odorifer]OME55388.1 hypothetical protein BSK59_12980 [Paenibacillus odorifer]